MNLNLNGKWLDGGDKKLFDKLPKYAQEKTILCTLSRTRDGNHCSLTFINKDGEEDYLDEYGIGDFLWLVRYNKDRF